MKNQDREATNQEEAGVQTDLVELKRKWALYRVVVDRSPLPG
jgi:hypothetical protein